jgi:hypothetical protein
MNNELNGASQYPQLFIRIMYYACKEKEEDVKENKKEKKKEVDREEEDLKW